MKAFYRRHRIEVKRDRCIGGRPVKAITIWQPWASLIAIGAKQYETRSWETKYRGPIAIHAAKKDPCKLPLLGMGAFEEATKEELEKAGLAWCLLPTGKIIATAELVECWKITDNGHTNGSPLAARIEGGRYGGKTNIVEGKEIFFGDWTPGRYAWEFTNMCMLPEPIPAKGKQGLWNWDVPEGVKLS